MATVKPLVKSKETEQLDGEQEIKEVLKNSSSISGGMSGRSRGSSDDSRYSSNSSRSSGSGGGGGTYIPITTAIVAAAAAAAAVVVGRRFICLGDSHGVPHCYAAL